ncbi:hypothetical protein B0H21DRAFT_338243 [Amylocystis lapponica]|nr:hypothetical protein B0H21DRAFT_338243 [Amylocystis lapponica]
MRWECGEDSLNAAAFIPWLAAGWLVCLDVVRTVAGLCAIAVCIAANAAGVRYLHVARERVWGEQQAGSVIFFGCI